MVRTKLTCSTERVTTNMMTTSQKSSRVKKKKLSAYKELTWNIEMNKYPWQDRITFQESGHRYELDNKPITGVTTILGMKAKPQLIGWAANQVAEYIKEQCEIHDEIYYVPIDDLERARVAHTKKKEGAADFGTHVHLACEIYALEQMGKEHEPMPILTEDEQVAFTNFTSWVTENNVKFLESEIIVYSESSWFCGTCDFVAEIDGKIWIGDIKTSSAIYPEMFWQTSAYQMCMQELGLYPEVEGHVIVNVKKNGKVDVERSYGYERNIEAFKACLTLYRVSQAGALELPKKYGKIQGRR